MGKRRPRQQSIWVPAAEMLKSDGHPFYAKVEEVLVIRMLEQLGFLARDNVEETQILVEQPTLICRSPAPTACGKSFWPAKSGASVCLGIASTAPVTGLVHKECPRPSRLR